MSPIFIQLCQNRIWHLRFTLILVTIFASSCQGMISSGGGGPILGFPIDAAQTTPEENDEEAASSEVVVYDAQGYETTLEPAAVIPEPEKILEDFVAAPAEAPVETTFLPGSAAEESEVQPAETELTDVDGPVIAVLPPAKEDEDCTPETEGKTFMYLVNDSDKNGVKIETMSSSPADVTFMMPKQTEDSKTTLYRCEKGVDEIGHEKFAWIETILDADNTDRIDETILRRDVSGTISFEQKKYKVSEVLRDGYLQTPKSFVEHDEKETMVLRVMNITFR